MHEKNTGERVLRVYGAGTICTDVSAMGLQEKLMGQSSLPLAIWMSEILRTLPVTRLFAFDIPLLVETGHFEFESFS